MRSAQLDRTNRIQSASSLVGRVVWGFFYTVVAVYSIYAFYMAAIEILSRFGMVGDAPHRAAPLVFVFHAITGGIALLVGSIQFNRTVMHRMRRLHRVLGRVYVVTIWASSVGSLWLTIFFDVSIPTKIVFGVLSLLWFATTTQGYLAARSRRFYAHREWMLRSYALSFFFVTFSFWVPGLAGTDLPETIRYPLAALLSWGLNLLAVEVWIRHIRSRSGDWQST